MFAEFIESNGAAAAKDWPEGICPGCAGIVMYEEDEDEDEDFLEDDDLAEGEGEEGDDDFLEDDDDGVEGEEEFDDDDEEL